MPTVHLLSRAVVRDANHVLVVRADGHPHTFLPGGHREPGEGLEACLRRELHEELGVASSIERYLGGVEHSWRRDGEPQYEINHCFLVDVPSLTADTTPRAREEHLSFAWAPAADLGTVSLEPAPLRHLLTNGTAPRAPWWASTLSDEAGRSVRPRS